LPILPKGGRAAVEDAHPGVFSSTNGGTSWISFAAGLPNTIVTNWISLPQFSLLAAATYGRGVFEITLPASTNHFGISAPPSAAAGTGFSITVTAENPGGSTDTGSTGTVHSTSSDLQAVLPPWQHALSAIEQGDPHAAEQLLPLVYEELRRLAAQKLAQEKPGQTLEATALVHEAFLRLEGVDKAWRRARGGVQSDSRGTCRCVAGP
jgi:hypothetical protein